MDSGRLRLKALGTLKEAYYLAIGAESDLGGHLVAIGSTIHPSS